jgi:hypothetical protein
MNQQNDLGMDKMKDITMAMIEAGRKFSDGHFTLMAFTTNWRASFGTPSGRDDIKKMKACETPDEAIKAAFCDMIKYEFEKKMTRKFDAALSKKLDCIMFILEN